MIKNYLKTGLRYLLNNKGYTAINILGLAVGITACLLIMLFVKSEWSYDKFHSKAGRIYRTWQHEKVEGQDFINTVTPLPMGPSLKEGYPEVEDQCRVLSFSPVIKIDQHSFSEDVRMVDSTFFRLFDFELVTGNRSQPFPTANSVILTKELAKKYFGEKNVVGKNIEMQLGDEKMLFTVTGIAEKPAEASSIKFKMLIPFSNSRFMFRPAMFTSWTNVFTETYVLLRDNAKASVLESKFPAMLKKVLGEDYKEGAFMVHLQPIADIHLNKTLPAGNEPVSDPKYSYILASIGVLLLLIACVNFITLSVGRSATRAMEVGVRKVMGAERIQLIRQFWGEAFLVTLIAVLIGIGTASLLVGPFNRLISRDLSMQFDLLFCIFLFLLIVVIAFISGIYPAIVLSRFNPIEVLKGKLRMKGNSGWLQQSMVTGQFVVSIALIICTLTIGRQMNYLSSKDLGYNKEQVVVVETNKSRKEGFPLANLYRQELLKNPEVIAATASVYSLAETQWLSLGYLDDKRGYKNFQYNAIDPHFINTMKLQVIQGRDFDAANAADNNSSAIVNEAFVKDFGITDPVGKKLPGSFDQQIIGVVKDFNIQSLHTKVLPLLISLTPDSILQRVQDVNYSFSPQPRISVRLKAGDIAGSIKMLKQAWQSVAPGQDFEYKFLDETVAAQYKAEQRTSSIVKIASALSIFIACMGLFGLTTLAVVRRTKEIGIRKVMGADVSSIVRLVAKDFLKLIIIAAVIAFPLAWWFVNDWLKDFAYRVNISWTIFVLAAVSAIILALLTISFQAIKAAIANPVKSLRTE